MGNLEDQIKAKAKETGYESCGIIDAASFEEFLGELERRSALFPYSAPFYDSLRRQANPKERIDWAKSIIVCLRRYDRYQIPDGLDRFVGKYYLVDGRLKYSKSHAGHDAFTRFLQELGLRTARDAAPARWSAVKAGLGKFRNNNFVYTKRGSWNVINTWVVDKQLEHEGPVDHPQFACPEDCNKCIQACPTAALSAPLTMDATRCISYLTFNQGASHAKNLWGQMGTWLYGCDVCQNICPANAKTWQETEDFPEPWPLKDLLTPESLLSMDEETYLVKLQPRFWYIGKDDIWQWKCNAIRVMANDYVSKYEQCITRALADPNENVRATARWALGKAGIA